MSSYVREANRSREVRHLFVALPYGVHFAHDTRVRPIANSAIVIANVVAFCLQSPAWFLGPGTPWWSVFSYGFSHANQWHLIGNMFVLLMIGNPVNRRVGNGWYAAAYLGTIVCMGTFGRLLGIGPLMGSSGAIFAVVAMLLMLMPAAIVDMGYTALFPVTVLAGFAWRPKDPVEWFIRWGTFRIRAWLCFLLVPIVEVWGFLWGRYQFGTWQWNHPAHLLGLVCGVAAVLLLPLHISMGRRSGFGDVPDVL